MSDDNRTVPGIGPGSWDSGTLAREQESAVEHRDTNRVLYRLYTEKRDNLAYLVRQYFDGATLIDGIGLWQGTIEESTIIEILGSPADLQNIVHLAGDIRHVNEQTCVIVTWQPISRLDVTT